MQGRKRAQRFLEELKENQNWTLFGWNAIAYSVIAFLLGIAAIVLLLIGI
jgi:disulfide bond formation protein DsbB